MHLHQSKEIKNIDQCHDINPSFEIRIIFDNGPIRLGCLWGICPYVSSTSSIFNYKFQSLLQYND